MKTSVFVKPEEIEAKEWIDEENFYEEDARILLLEDDELTSSEIGFMQGYDKEPMRKNTEIEESEENIEEEL